MKILSRQFFIYFMFAQKHRLWLDDTVLTSTHNLCFGEKIRKIGIPLQTPVFYIKLGFKGVYISWICFPDDHKFFTTRMKRKNAGFPQTVQIKIPDFSTINP